MRLFDKYRLLGMMKVMDIRIFIFYLPPNIHSQISKYSILCTNIIQILLRCRQRVWYGLLANNLRLKHFLAELLLKAQLNQCFFVFLSNHFFHILFIKHTHAILFLYNTSHSLINFIAVFKFLLRNYFLKNFCSNPFKCRLIWC